MLLLPELLSNLNCLAGLAGQANSQLSPLTAAIAAAAAAVYRRAVAVVNGIRLFHLILLTATQFSKKERSRERKKPIARPIKERKRISSLE